MGLFNRKKKPWEYRTDAEKMLSVINDFPNNDKVLKRVIKEESNDIKAIALMKYLDHHKMGDTEDLILFLVKDCGLSADEAADFLIDFAEKIKEFKESKD